MKPDLSLMIAAASAAALIVLAACQSLATGETSAMAEETRHPEGREIADTLCASCHAIGRRDTSTHAEAPPLRLLSQKYPVEMLAEALAEGILVGHPDMPAFVLHPEQIDDLLDYLEEIQVAS